MLRLAVTFILLLLMLFGAAVWLLDMGPPSHEPEQQAKERAQPKSPSTSEAASSEAQDLQEALRPSTKPSDGGASFDVARIDPNGTSVFAGRAEPRSLVTVTADGKEVGTAQADENGEWTLTTDAKIPNPDAKLALFKAPPGAVPHVVGAGSQSAQASAATGPAAAQPKTAGTVASGMLKSLESMVAAARSAGERPAAAAAPPPVSLGDKPAPGAAAPSTGPSGAQSMSVPVPITFVFNEATLTGDGSKAASLLLEYLQLKRFSKVTLTGHADERGSDDLNLGLSRERLETVARYLRAGGYKGQLELIAKGKSEPYAGVVRGDFSREDLWQLDRRVELIVSR